MCAVTVDGQDLLASGGDDGTVRIWDPATGEQRAVLEGHQDWVGAVCAVTVDGRDLLASGGDDGAVRIWDPATGEQRAVLEGHQGGVDAVCAVTVDGRDLLASGGDDRTVRIWDPATGEQRAVLEGHQGSVSGVVRGRRERPGSARQRRLRRHGADLGPGHARTARRPGRPPGTWSTGCARSPWTARTCSPAAALDGTVRIWDPAPASSAPSWKATRAGSTGCARSPWTARTCSPAAATTGRCGSGTLATGEQRAILEGHQDWVNAVCAVTVDGQDLLASGGDDGTVRIWDPATGEQRAVLEGHQDWVSAVCAVTVNGQDLLASGDDDGTVRIWDPATGEQRAILEGHQGWVNAVCVVTVNGQDLLASAGSDQTVRIWDPATGEQRAVLEGHQDSVYAVCAITVNGRDLLASAGDDRNSANLGPTDWYMRADFGSLPRSPRSCLGSRFAGHWPERRNPCDQTKPGSHQLSLRCLRSDPVGADDRVVAADLVSCAGGRAVSQASGCAMAS